jgi:hypothetical protein
MAFGAQAASDPPARPARRGSCCPSPPDRAGVLFLVAAGPRSVSLARAALLRYAAREGASKGTRDALGLAITSARVTGAVRLEVRASRVNGPLVVEIRVPGRPGATVRKSFAMFSCAGAATRPRRPSPATRSTR